MTESGSLPAPVVSDSSSVTGWTEGASCAGSNSATAVTGSVDGVVWVTVAVTGSVTGSAAAVVVVTGSVTGVVV